MNKNKFMNFVRYHFDNLMSKGTIAPLILLIVSSFIFLFILSIIIMFFDGMPTTHINGLDNSKNINIFDTFYVTFLRMLDPGVVSADTSERKFSLFMIIATLFGLVMVSTLIAIINNGVISKINNLRKGKSQVIESNHTVILGWSFQVFPVISELIIANENQKKGCIVILADKDKVEMEDEIRTKVGNTKNTKIVCRTGNPIDIHDLSIVNLNESRSIIIIAPDTEDPDSNVIKTILAITNNPHRKPEPEKYHIVAEIRDPKNIVIAEIAGKDEVQLVVFDYLISRITAQTCRQPGLSVVFTELLDFSGDEIYFQSEPRLAGKTFVESMFSYETSTIIGVRKRDGKLLLKPNFDMILEHDDKLIAISEDDDTIKMSGLTDFKIDNTAIQEMPVKEVMLPESTLVIGWNRRASLIINELDNYVAPGSKITLVSENIEAEKELSISCGNLNNQTVTFWFGDTTNRRILDDLNATTYDHIIVLSNTDMTNVQATDARTLRTLLHLRDIADSKGHDFSIVSEMLDDRNRELAEVTNTDDFIVSVKLDSLMLSQISENKELKLIFEEIFSAGGRSIYICPAEQYIELNKAVNFYTVMEAARKQGQIAIGVKLQSILPKYETDQMLAHGVIVNPIKSRNIFFTDGDKIIILADDESLNI
jgi:voltage-gated potassium channel Kch